jgi:hypothetical protein
MTPVRLRITDNIIWYDIWKEIDTKDIRSDALESYLIHDLQQVGLDSTQVKSYSWIINSGWEGYDRNDIEHFRKLLLGYGLSEKNFGAIFIGYENTATLPYPAQCFTDRMIYEGSWYQGLEKQDINWADLPMTSWFTVLMRRASVSRCHLASRLLQHFDPHNMIMTLGTTGWTDDPLYLKEIIEYPIVVDEKDTPYPTNLIHNHQLFYQAPVQLVVESSSETDENVWRSIFVTEKTYKALAWHQFPLWYAVPGMVTKIREQGFDVFDDLINHSYNNEHNAWVRMIAVVKEMQNVISKGGRSLRKEHWRRLESNAALVKKIHTNAHKEHKKQTNRLINELQ